MSENNTRGRFIWYDLMTPDGEGAKPFHSHGDDREQVPAETMAGYLSLGHEQRAAGPQHAPHLAQRRHPQVLGQVVHHQAGHHDVEMLGGEIQRFGRADPELAISGTASLAASVGDHLRRWIDTDDLAFRADRPGEQPREVAGAAADIQHALARSHASRSDQCLKGGAPAAEEEDDRARFLMASYTSSASVGTAYPMDFRCSRRVSIRVAGIPMSRLVNT